MTAAVELEPLIGPHTVDEWLSTPDREDGSRLELMWGYWHVSPAPTGEHQNAASNIWHILKTAIRTVGRKDLYAVQAVAIRISTPMRYGLIPDVAILNEPPIGTSFAPEALKLAVEVWSPSNKKRERDTKIAGYAAAGVPYLWTVEIKRGWRLSVQGFELTNGAYQLQASNTTNDETLTMPAPIPVTLSTEQLISLW